MELQEIGKLRASDDMIAVPRIPPRAESSRRSWAQKSLGNAERVQTSLKVSSGTVLEIRHISCRCLFRFCLGLVGRKDGELIAQRTLKGRTRFTALLISCEVRKLSDHIGVVEIPKDGCQDEVANCKVVPFQPLLFAQPIGYPR